MSGLANNDKISKRPASTAIENCIELQYHTRLDDFFEECLNQILLTYSKFEEV
jgi:hypothetical protein